MGESRGRAEVADAELPLESATGGDDLAVDAGHIGAGEGSLIGEGGHPLQHLALAVGGVGAPAGGVFGCADLLRLSSPLLEEFDNLGVQIVDGLAAAADRV